jgi:enterochelin esterase-like enzyme
MQATVAHRFPARAAGAAAGALLVVFVAVGLVALKHYGLNYWLYRGFDPPRDPAFVKVHGTTERFDLASPALGGRKQAVYVYLPPGYATSGRRYPVLYLLHGFPGRPLAFLQTVRMGVVEDTLVALHRAQPLILVMPYGSTGTFTDKEWVDGVGRGEGWATFVWRDLVRAVDARYRTIPSGAGRAIAGLSEGGYGAVDIALRHPREFSVVESWSGYEQPDKLRSIFGANLQLLAPNDPTALLPHDAQRLRALRAYFWFYSGSEDPLRRQNVAFAAELSRLRVAHRYFEVYGGHNWALWRGNARASYLVAAARLAHA